MQQHNVIGITTTGCASRWEVLQALEPEILICEEAGEVMEPHALCSLFPSLKHCIFIGDPLQLRPEVNEQLMTLETRIGSMYRLDESLFERIMMPRDSLASILPTSQLNIQRRMHPEIAQISRITYPFLKDHQSTIVHPLPKSIGSRIHWLDHRVPEFTEPETSNSVCNLHEVDLVRAFVQYLLRGSGYSFGDIAVLTPYAAQLSRLHEALKSTCAIWLSEKDREMLLDNGQLDLEYETELGKMDVEMGNMLRIATVDNFQGEEAKIVILSTVRSGGATGFLRTPNRINVACSRARDGFYIIGNAETLSQVAMWKQIIDIFNAANELSPSILLQCDRHPQHNQYASSAGDFDAFEECSKICGITLPCGHICNEPCHDLDLHDRMPCLQSCKNILACGHQCPGTCAEKCGFCNQAPELTILDCGHEGTKYCSGEITKCIKIVEERNLSCGRHTVEIKCGEQDLKYICTEKCGVRLPCGHDCPGSCEACQSDSTHQQCMEKCNVMQPCGHQCQSVCHPDKECPPCQLSCEEACQHGRCKLRCSEMCEVCSRQRVSACDHEEESNSVCSLPSTVATCSLPCEKILECGHPCTSLHNEVCPPKSACIQCHGSGFPDRVMLYNPPCGHAFDIQQSDILNLDSIVRVDMVGNIIGLNSDVAKENLRQPVCPLCTAGLCLHRYEVVEKLIELPDVLDRHLSKFGRIIYTLSEAVDMQKTRVEKTFKYFVENIRPSLRAAAINARIVLKRDRETQALQSQIREYRDRTIVPFEKHLANLHAAMPKLVSDYTFMFRLRADVLEYRAMFTSIVDRFRIIDFLVDIDDFSSELKRQALTMLEFVYTECTTGVAYCQNAIDDTRLATNPCLEIEIRLHQIRFQLLSRIAVRQLGLIGAAVPVRQVSARMSDPLVVLSEIETTARHYPSTCRPYSDVVTGFRSLIIEQIEEDISRPNLSEAMSNQFTRVKGIPNIYSAAARHIEKQWNEHALGSMTMCEKKHAYSSEAFPDFCPECGQREETKEEEKQRAQDHLFEADFLAAMHKAL